MNGEAMRRHGLVAQDWSSETLERLEDGLFVGFRIRANDAPAKAADLAPRGLGRALPTAVAATAQPAAELSSSEPAPAISAPAETTSLPAHPQPTTPQTGRAADDDEDFGFEEK